MRLLVTVGILVRLFQYFHLGALATDKKRLFCRRLSVYVL